MSKRKRGRPEYVPTEKDRTVVEIMAAGGMTQENIALALGIHYQTLTKHYKDELTISKFKWQAEVLGALRKKILAGDTASIIYFLKTQMGNVGWREQSVNINVDASQEDILLDME